MLAHDDIWAAIDALAKNRGLSVSGLARSAGLDPTTFNPSKRVSRNGKKRWPGTESIAKILRASNISFSEFAALVGGDTPAVHGGRAAIPVTSLTCARAEDCFDSDGGPKGNCWNAIAFLDNRGDHLYALDITGAELEPLYSDGDTVIVSMTGNIRNGDKVIARITSGDLLVARVGRMTVDTVDFHPFGPSGTVHSYPNSEILWISRIIWASQ